MFRCICFVLITLYVYAVPPFAAAEEPCDVIAEQAGMLYNSVRVDKVDPDTLLYALKLKMPPETIPLYKAMLFHLHGYKKSKAEFKREWWQFCKSEGL